MSVDHQYIEVSPQREFANGLQDWIWNIQRPNACFMDKSYMKYEMKVTGPGGAVPNVGNQIALAESCIANMYLNAMFLAGSQNVSTLMNYFPQCSAIEYEPATRMHGSTRLGPTLSATTGIAAVASRHSRRLWAQHSSPSPSRRVRTRSTSRPMVRLPIPLLLRLRMELVSLQDRSAHSSPLQMLVRPSSSMAAHSASRRTQT